MSKKERFAVWPDGTYCEEDDIEDYLDYMSDDYALVEEPELESALKDIYHSQE